MRHNTRHYDHRQGQTSTFGTFGTTRAAWLTLSLIFVLPLGPTSTAIAAKPQVAPFYISLISALYLGHLLLTSSTVTKYSRTDAIFDLGQNRSRT